MFWICSSSGKETGSWWLGFWILGAREHQRGRISKISSCLLTPHSFLKLLSLLFDSTSILLLLLPSNTLTWDHQRSNPQPQTIVKILSPSCRTKSSFTSSTSSPPNPSSSLQQSLDFGGKLYSHLPLRFRAWSSVMSITMIQRRLSLKQMKSSERLLVTLRWATTGWD